MQKVINRMMYDTDKADLIAHSSKNNLIAGTLLYRSKRGNFFICVIPHYSGGGGHGSVFPVTPIEAEKRYTELPYHQMTFEEAFGIIPQEA